jgi:hypothetical protein
MMPKKLGTEFLFKQLSTLFDQIEEQLEAIQDQAEKIGCQVHELRNADGSWAAASLLAAKAQILNALTLLEVE